MEFFTAFFIEYMMNDKLVQSYLVLPTYEACQIMIRDNEDMYKYMFVDGDIDMYCLDTGVMSQSIRPKLRPDS